jgi:hypothetical protein
VIAPSTASESCECSKLVQFMRSLRLNHPIPLCWCLIWCWFVNWCSAIPVSFGPLPCSGLFVVICFIPCFACEMVFTSYDSSCIKHLLTTSNDLPYVSFNWLVLLKTSMGLLWSFGCVLGIWDANALTILLYGSFMPSFSNQGSITNLGCKPSIL